MRLEQVLAQWANGTSIASGTYETAGTSVAGRWTNEYGSVAEICVDGDRVFGTYTSTVGAETGALAKALLGAVKSASRWSSFPKER